MVTDTQLEDDDRALQISLNFSFVLLLETETVK